MDDQHISEMVEPEFLQSLGCKFQPGTEAADAWMEGWYAAVKFYDVDEDEDDDPLSEKDRAELVRHITGE